MNRITNATNRLMSPAPGTVSRRQSGPTVLPGSMSSAQSSRGHLVPSRSNQGEAIPDGEGHVWLEMDSACLHLDVSKRPLAHFAAGRRFPGWRPSCRAASPSPRLGEACFVDREPLAHNLIITRVPPFRARKAQNKNDDDDVGLENSIGVPGMTAGSWCFRHPQGWWWWWW
ncbi:hypothetical protein LZ32DRAFT_305586 [Colletotrichum eremochloae]|nr:hypothetical protein LZ32DRAFT_305586 [Colletotrichum eremochloae]